jgi:hypothetical protein
MAFSLRISRIDCSVDIAGSVGTGTGLFGRTTGSFAMAKALPLTSFIRFIQPVPKCEKVGRLRRKLS